MAHFGNRPIHPRRAGNQGAQAGCRGGPGHPHTPAPLRFARSAADAEAAAGVKLLWKIPNQYFAVSTAIDRGVPVVAQNHTEIGRAFTGLAARLTENDLEVKRKAWSLFKTV